MRGGNGIGDLDFHIVILNFGGQRTTLRGFGVREEQMTKMSQKELSISLTQGEVPKLILCFEQHD